MIETKDRIKGVIGDATDKARVWTQEVSDQARAMGKELEGSAAGAAVCAVKDKVQDVAASASELVFQAKDTAQEWASSAGDAAVHVKDKAQEMAAAAVETVGDLGEDVTALVRRHPVPAMLLAIGAGVGLGFLLAELLRRPSSGGA